MEVEESQEQRKLVEKVAKLKKKPRIGDLSQLIDRIDIELLFKSSQ